MEKENLQKRTINLGFLKLPLFAKTFGQGFKKIGLVFGIHGVETTGLFVLQNLWKKKNFLKNKVKVIPSANPSGLILSNRFSGLDLPMDVKDPNRSFPGKRNGGVQDQISAAVLDLISDCDFVLDIHNYSNFGQAFPILSLEGMEVQQGRIEINQETLNFLRSLETNFAFFVDAKQAGKRGFAGTLNEVLNKRGIPNLALELPPIEFLSEEELEVFSEKLVRAINCVGRKVSSEFKMPKLINTQIARSRKAGIFLPALKPPVEIKKRQLLGKIFDPFCLETVNVRSPKDGLLVVIKRKNFVRVGEFLYEIGWEVRPEIVVKSEEKK